MRTSTTPIPGPVLLEPEVFGDGRGFFMETWNAESFAQAGIEAQFVQDNHSRSQRGVLRGLHFQNPCPQGKLVRVSRGAVYDVVVDLRRSSSHFGQWAGVTLTAENRKMLWIPEGFAHGFLTLEDETDFVYKCTERYAPEFEHVLAWNDPGVNVDWPIQSIAPILSPKDAKGKALSEVLAFP